MKKMATIYEHIKGVKLQKKITAQFQELNDIQIREQYGRWSTIKNNV